MDTKNKFYILPDLPYGYEALSPALSGEQMRIHHDKHHAAYVNGANALLESMDKARKEKSDIDYGTLVKQLTFNTAGHALHSLFWRNLRAPRQDNIPDGKIGEKIVEEFGSFERFKKEFSQVALKTEGSGWAVLTYCLQTERPIIMQIEKHHVNVNPSRPILMVLDVWEHAYYIDYRNDRAKYIENFWSIADWKEADNRLVGLL